LAAQEAMQDIQDDDLDDEREDVIHDEDW